MRPPVVLLVAILGSAVGLPAQDFVAERDRVLDFLDRHCAHCHDADSHEGDVDFDRFRSFDSPLAWLQSTAALRIAGFRAVDGLMPPREHEHQPPRSERLAFERAVDQSLRGAALRLPPEPFDCGQRRLTRTQFENAVRDLFGVEVEIRRWLPEDARAHGFAGVAAAQRLESGDLDAWLFAVDAALDQLDAHGAARDVLFAASGCVAEDPSPALRQILRTAFRRPPTEAQVTARAQLFAEVFATTGSLALAQRRTLQSILLSPHFLLRLEPDAADAPSGSIRALDSHEMATRLAFALTGSPPDAELRAQADRNELVVLERLLAAADRLRRSEAALAFVDEFFGQWLGFDRLPTLTRDVRRYPFPRPLRDAMLTEIRQSLVHIVRTNRSVIELLDADWTVVDEHLAAHYGLDPPAQPGPQVVRVADRRRGGLSGMAGILALTSNPLRTNPVARGRFVVEDLFGDPPPPPPKGAGVLPEDDRLPDKLSLRARLEQHRADPRCASCHSRIDPLGLALESLDAMGRARIHDDERPLDTCTQYGSEVLDGPVALKAFLVARADRFVYRFAERLFTYLLGRPVRAADQGVIFAMVDAARRDDYRFGALLDALVSSPAFRYRQKP